MVGKVEVVIVITPAEVAEVARLLSEPQVGPGAEPGCMNNVDAHLPGISLHFLNADSPHVKRMFKQAAQPVPAIVMARQMPPEKRN